MKWAEDKDAAQCQQCNQPFSLARRKVACLTDTPVISSSAGLPSNVASEPFDSFHAGYW